MRTFVKKPRYLARGSDDLCSPGAQRPETCAFAAWKKKFFCRRERIECSWGLWLGLCPGARGVQERKHQTSQDDLMLPASQGLKNLENWELVARQNSLFCRGERLEWGRGCSVVSTLTGFMPVRVVRLSLAGRREGRGD